MRRNYDDPVYKEWRLEVYKRAGFKCQMPGCNSKRQLQAHHIYKWSTAPSMRYDTANGICLCRTCHSEVNRNESFYIDLFLDIVGESDGKKGRS